MQCFAHHGICQAYKTKKDQAAINSACLIAFRRCNECTYIYVHTYVRTCVCVCVAATTLIWLHVSCCTLLSVRQRHTVHNYVHYIVYVSSMYCKYVRMYVCMYGVYGHTYISYVHVMHAISKQIISWELVQNCLSLNSLSLCHSLSPTCPLAGVMSYFTCKCS